jgi:hypothetical protein
MFRLNYEDLARSPQAALDNLTSKFGMERYIAPKYMVVEEDHTIGGTPNRFEKRPIVYEEGWKKNYKNRKLLYITGNVLNKL